MNVKALQSAIKTVSSLEEMHTLIPLRPNQDIHVGQPIVLYLSGETQIDAVANLANVLRQKETELAENVCFDWTSLVICMMKRPNAGSKRFDAGLMINVQAKPSA